MKPRLIALALLGFCWATHTAAAPAQNTANAKGNHSAAACATGTVAVAIASKEKGVSVTCTSTPAKAEKPKVTAPPKAKPAGQLPGKRVAKPAKKSSNAIAPKRHSDGLTHWENFGADPAYTSRQAAIADAENVFKRAGWPPDVAAEMAAKMRAGPGERYVINNGDRLDFMRSGASGLWKKVLVAFRKPPTLGMEFSAPAERWVIVKDGVTYEAIRPEVCNNIAGRKTGTPATPCDLIIVPIHRVGEVAAGIPIYGPGKSKECHGYRKVEITGRTIRFVGPRGEITPGCIGPAQFCSYRRTDEIVSPKVRTATGVITGLTPGYYAISVSRGFSTNPDAGLGVCVKYIDPQTGKWEISFVPVVRDIDYVTMDNGQRVAFIAYNRAGLPPGVQMNDPRGLFLWR